VSFRARIAVGSRPPFALVRRGGVGCGVLIAREQLRRPVDEALEARAAQIAGQRLGVIPAGRRGLPRGPPRVREARGYVQLVRTNGDVLVPPRQSIKLPVDQHVLDVAGHGGAAFWDDVTVDDTHLRVFTFAYAPVRRFRSPVRSPRSSSR
jgi:hypothetical protein